MTFGIINFTGHCKYRWPID